jgi:hypothetical protein
MRAPFEIISEWRAAMRELDATSRRSDEWWQQRGRVDQLRVEYLESFDRILGRRGTWVASRGGNGPAVDQRHDPDLIRIAEASSGLLSTLEEVRLLEEHKRSLGVGTGEFNRLAIEVERTAGQLLDQSRVQREIGARLAANDVTTEDLERHARDATAGDGVAHDRAPTVVDDGVGARVSLPEPATPG